MPGTTIVIFFIILIIFAIVSGGDELKTPNPEFVIKKQSNSGPPNSIISTFPIFDSGTWRPSKYTPELLTRLQNDTPPYLQLRGACVDSRMLSPAGETNMQTPGAENYIPECVRRENVHNPKYPDTAPATELHVTWAVTGKFITRTGITINYYINNNTPRDVKIIEEMLKTKCIIYTPGVKSIITKINKPPGGEYIGTDIYTTLDVIKKKSPIRVTPGKIEDAFTVVIN